MKNRVVISGMGVVAPNGTGLTDFKQALLETRSGLRFFPELKNLGFRCQVAGQPAVPESRLRDYFTELELKSLNSSGIVYGTIAGVDAWRDAGFVLEDEDVPKEGVGIIFGTGTLGVEKFRESIHHIDAGNTRRLGSTSVLQTMSSGISAFLNSRIGAGNQVTTNSSACTTGTEALIMGYERISSGKADIMLVGSCGDSGPYIWGGFDAMRILPNKYNEQPESASRPLDTGACGFVPASGAGALVLESLENAQKRKARIYAEVLGGAINSGGQRQGGSMTAPNSQAVQKCIKQALEDAGISGKDVDVINGHLTATTMDPVEVENWLSALKINKEDFPLINSIKGMTGHCLSAAGSVESVASVLQITEGFVFGNRNSEDLHPKIENLIGREKVPLRTIQRNVNTVVKASFGFGDVNAVAVFKKYDPLEERINNQTLEELEFDRKDSYI